MRGKYRVLKIRAAAAAAAAAGVVGGGVGGEEEEEERGRGLAVSNLDYVHGVPSRVRLRGSGELSRPGSGPGGRSSVTDSVTEAVVGTSGDVGKGMLKPPWAIDYDEGEGGRGRRSATRRQGRDDGAKDGARTLSHPAGRVAQAPREEAEANLSRPAASRRESAQRHENNGSSAPPWALHQEGERQDNAQASQRGSTNVMATKGAANHSQPYAGDVWKRPKTIAPPWAVGGGQELLVSSPEPGRKVLVQDECCCLSQTAGFVPRQRAGFLRRQRPPLNSLSLLECGERCCRLAAIGELLRFCHSVTC